MITSTSKILPETPNVIVTLAKAKLQLRIDALFTTEDDLIQDYINAAIATSEQYLNADIISKTLVIKLDGFQSKLAFDTYPVREITSVKYFVDNVETTMPATDYYITLDNKQSTLIFKEQPTTDERFDAVTITATIGFESAAHVPHPIKQAILLQISDMYERREDRPEMITTAAQALMRPYRKYHNG